MRFNKILHPEVLLNRRGSDYARKVYEKALSMIKITEQGVYFEANDDLSWLIARSLEKDHIFLRFMVNCKIFKEKKGYTYHVGKDFLQALQKIDREIPIDILPETFTAYFSFSEDSVFDEDGSVEGGYVTIGTGKSLGMKSDRESKVISFSYICKQKDANLMPPFVSFTTLLDSKKIDDLVNDVETTDFFGLSSTFPDEEIIKTRNNVFRALLNSVIYLHSTEPFVEFSRPIKQSELSANEHRRRGLIINDCTLPVSFLYPKYVKTSFKKESTWVDSFLRWQRCGVNFSQVKLVFVTPHERRYKKIESNSELTR